MAKEVLIHKSKSRAKILCFIYFNSGLYNTNQWNLNVVISKVIINCDVDNFYPASYIKSHCNLLFHYSVSRVVVLTVVLYFFPYLLIGTNRNVSLGPSRYTVTFMLPFSVVISINGNTFHVLFL